MNPPAPLAFPELPHPHPAWWVSCPDPCLPLALLHPLLACPPPCHTAQQMLAPRGPWLSPAGRPHLAGPAPLCLTTVGTGLHPAPGRALLWALPCVLAGLSSCSAHSCPVLPGCLQGWRAEPAWDPGLRLPAPLLCSLLPPRPVTWDSQAVLAERFPRVPLAGAARLNPASRVGGGLHTPLPCPPQGTVSGDGVLLVALTAGAWDPAHVPVTGVLLQPGAQTTYSGCPLLRSEACSPSWGRDGGAADRAALGVGGDPTGSCPGSPLTTAIWPSQGGRRPCVSTLQRVPPHSPGHAPHPLAAPPWEHVDAVGLLSGVC